MELQVYRQDGSETGRTISLDASVFGIKQPNDHAIWLDVRAIQANGRQGTHKTKDRGEVAGSTRKLYRQKGTGFARAGSAKSPIRRSGGTIFGPRPRTYGISVNKKVKRLARRSALTYKQQANAIRVVEDFSLDAPSTKSVVRFLGALQVTGQRTLILTAGPQEILYKSARNIPKVQVRQSAVASTLDIMLAKVLVIQESALPILSSILVGTPKTEAAAN